MFPKICAFGWVLKVQYLSPMAVSKMQVEHKQLGEVSLMIKTNLYSYHLLPPLSSFFWKAEDLLVFVWCWFVGLILVCLPSHLVIPSWKLWTLPLQWKIDASNFQNQHIHITFSFVKIIFNYKRLLTCNFLSLWIIYNYIFLSRTLFW